MSAPRCPMSPALRSRPRSAPTDHALDLWVTSDPTAVLLRGLSEQLKLDWTLNRPARPELLVLTNLGASDPAQLIARCRPKRAALCLDDRAGRSFLERSGLPCFTYSEGRAEADLTAHDLRTSPNGVTFLAVTQRELERVSVPSGALYHALAALASACALGVPLACAAPAVTELFATTPSAVV